MKLKVALLSIFLTGCAYQGDVVRDYEVGQVRTAAEQKTLDGELKWHNGTGVVYTKGNTQCGKNCANHAELALKMDREKAAREAAGNPEWDRIVEREKIAYKRNSVYTRCQTNMNMILASAEDKWHDSLVTNGYNSKATRESGSKLIELRKRSHKLVNDCVEVGLKDESN